MPQGGVLVPVGAVGVRVGERLGDWVGESAGGRPCE